MTVLLELAELADEEINQKIADLTAIRTTLTEVIDARCDSLTNCTCTGCPIPYPTIGTAPSGGAA